MLQGRMPAGHPQQSKRALAAHTTSTIGCYTDVGSVVVPQLRHLMSLHCEARYLDAGDSAGAVGKNGAVEESNKVCTFLYSIAVRFTNTRSTERGLVVVAEARFTHFEEFITCTWR